ncbi:MAG: hypothetical protein IJ555_08325 [Ruminococcus sp.]|nr:hypothetical protein [Ruminococcus sp.]
MKHYYTIEIANIRFGSIRRVTVKAETRAEAIKQTVVNVGERIVAAWEV